MKVKFFGVLAALTAALSLASCEQVDINLGDILSSPTYTETGDTAVTEKAEFSLSDIFSVNICEKIGHVAVTDKEVAPTAFVEGKTEGKHCAVCNEILVEQQPIEVLSPVEIDFPSGSITSEETIIVTDHLRLTVPANVYIPDDLVDNINIVTSAMETVSGMNFEGNSEYSPERLAVEVVKMTDTECELGPAYGYHGGFTISSGDLIDLYALMHEASHSLQYNQSPWSYCTWALEGISTYTTYKTQAYIAQNYPELIPRVGTVNNSFGNYDISDYSELYKYPLEYWMENTFEFSGNQNYSIGFRFMWYLDEVYGDYTKWIYEYEKMNPYCTSVTYTDMVSTDEQIKAFKSAYGEEVFDRFYPWLKANENLFSTRYSVDLVGAEKIQIYPTCAYGSIYYSFSGGFYNDLYIDIEAGKHYLNEYKNKNTDEMVMKIGEGITVELYDNAGRLLRTETSNYKDFIDLNGVSFIKLVGGGCFNTIEITGFENYGN